MNVKQMKVVQRFAQVGQFLDANQALIDPASVAAQRAVLTQVITQVTTYSQQQRSKGVETVQAHTVASLRDSLRDSYMRPIATIALAKLPITPNLRSSFTLPAVKANPLVLITAAQAMAQAAQPYAQVFIQNGLKTTFVDDINQAISALHDAVTAENNSKVTTKGATAGIKNQLTAGRGAVRLIDAIVRPDLANNKTLLSQWNTVKRTAGGPNLGTPAPLPNVLQPITQAPSTGTTPVSTPATTTTQPAATAAPATSSTPPATSTAPAASTTQPAAPAEPAASTGATAPVSAPASTPASVPASPPPVAAAA